MDDGCRGRSRAHPAQQRERRRPEHRQREVAETGAGVAHRDVVALQRTLRPEPVADRVDRRRGAGLFALPLQQQYRGGQAARQQSAGQGIGGEAVGHDRRRCGMWFADRWQTTFHATGHEGARARRQRFDRQPRQRPPRGGRRRRAARRSDVEAAARPDGPGGRLAAPPAGHRRRRQRGRHPARAAAARPSTRCTSRAARAVRGLRRGRRAPRRPGVGAGRRRDARSAYHRSKKAADDAPAGAAAPPSSAAVAGVRRRRRQRARCSPAGRAAVLPLPAGGRQRVQPVHVDDLVAALRRAGRAAAAARGRIALVGPRAAARLRDYLQRAARRAGPAAGAGASPVPAPLVRVAARARRPAAGEPARPRDLADAGARQRRAGRRHRARCSAAPPRAGRATSSRAEAADALRHAAQLGWLLPCCGCRVALVWIVTGIVSLGLYPVAESYALLARVGIPARCAPLMLYGAALLDLALGVATLLLQRRTLAVAGADRADRRLHRDHQRAPAGVLAASLRAAAEEPADAGASLLAAATLIDSPRRRRADGIPDRQVAAHPVVDGAVRHRPRLGLLHALRQPERDAARGRRVVALRGDGRLAVHDADHRHPAADRLLPGAPRRHSADQPLDRLVVRAVLRGRRLLAAGGVDPDPDAPHGRGGGRARRAAAGAYWRYLPQLDGARHARVRRAGGRLLSDGGQAGATFR